MAKQTTHTKAAYGALDTAYDYFNKQLFGNKLKSCLITLRRHKGALGYFHDSHFNTITKKEEVVHEISLNPEHFKNRTLEQTLSTLVHEMAHLWQEDFGKPGVGAYHNKEWAAKMKELGLHPSSTGKEGGKEVGTKVSHYILKGEGFDKACTAFLKANDVVLYQEKGLTGAARKAKNASKTKYSCECGCNIWGKPGLSVTCDECNEQFVEA